MNTLFIEAISAQMAGMTVLDSVTFTVKPQEVVAVIGPPGCGKQSLLRVLTGQLQARSGRILWGSEDITACPPDQRPFVALKPRDASMGECHVIDHLRAARLATENQPPDTEHLLHLLELMPYAKTPMASLNADQYQRVALACALLQTTAMVLLDMCAMLGCASEMVRLQACLRHIRREIKPTIIMVADNACDVLPVANRLVVMAGGRVRQVGAVDALYRYPGDAHVACSVGHCNLIPGEYMGAGLFRSQKGMRLPCANPYQNGASATVLAIRPEAIAIGPPMGGMQALVTDVAFMGAQIEYQLDLDGHALRAVAPAWGSGIPDLQPGAAVDVAWDAHDAQPLSY
ncbi:ATP-binding cassette domain-containing protein [Ottowia sp.]|uniref:ATP-binding cassette domain-containing protein n=1 Tax=Ottowia sp. TaxID=1898956 RepID=UPI003A865DF0